MSPAGVDVPANNVRCHYIDPRLSPGVWEKGEEKSDMSNL